jgi:hypothetical protein
MKRIATWKTVVLAVAGSLAATLPTAAETTIATFDDFNLDTLFYWSDATIVSSPTDYSITDVGYGSGYKNATPNIDATGETTIELTVTLSGPQAANGRLGPIVSLVDTDGTFVNFAWYGQTLGRHVLTKLLSAPTTVVNAGSVEGLDVANLDAFHLQLDPGSFGTSGAYTVVWENLRLTGAPRPRITSNSYDPATQEFTLAWTSRPGRTYSVLYAAAATDSFNVLVADIPSDDAPTTTTTVTMPSAATGFLRIQEQ